MTGQDEGFEGLDAELGNLETTLSSASAMTAAFQAELQSLQGTMIYTGREAGSMSRSIGGGLRRAFDGLVFDGLRLSDALRTVATSMVDAAYNTAMRPVQNALGGAIANGVTGLLSGILPFQHGGAFSQGRITPFARGGVVQGPSVFPMRGGIGLMGEAGPEAILPPRSWCRWSARRCEQRRRHPGPCHHEHHHARCAGLPSQPKPGRRRNGARAGPWATQSLRRTKADEFSRRPVPGELESRFSGRPGEAHRDRHAQQRIRGA